MTVALFAVGGHWLDGQAGTSPLFVLVGMVLGLVGGTIHMLRILAPSSLPFARSKSSSPASGSKATGSVAPAPPRAPQPPADGSSSDDEPGTS